jgi:apolipoprotein N-acyltransferase
VVACGFGHAHGLHAAGGFVSVALLQTNVSQDEKFAVDHMPQTLAWVGRELVAAKADLVVTPETAVPLLPDQLEPFAPGYWDAIRRHFAVPAACRAGGPAPGRL